MGAFLPRRFQKPSEAKYLDDCRIESVDLANESLSSGSLSQSSVIVDPLVRLQIRPWCICSMAGCKKSCGVTNVDVRDSQRMTISRL